MDMTNILHTGSADEQAAALGSEFLLDLSHDLRSPLAAAEGWLGFLLDGDCGPLNSDQRDAVTTAAASLKRLQGFIESTLERSRAGALEERMKEGEFAPLLRETLELFTYSARAKGLSLSARAKGAEARLLMDAMDIRRVLANLVGNAVKYTPPGGSVTVTAAVRNGLLTVYVSDTGCGIPEPALDGLFERYARAPQGFGEGQEPGTGLGLAIVRRIVEEHGGLVWADSEVGVGTTMAFALPLAGLTQEAFS